NARTNPPPPRNLLPRRHAKHRFCSCELFLLPRAFALVASPYPLTCLRLLDLFLNLRSNFSLLDL
ncbi:hypothetical protein S245_047395, partial [Arachis hypogaea]